MAGAQGGDEQGDRLPARLIYVSDPMCSWCWGFAPVLHALIQDFGFEAAVRLGGLRPGPEAKPLDEGLRGFLDTEWDRIADVTGQPFDKAALAREGWVYDTELPSLAVVAARRQGPAASLATLLKLQEAFYAQAIDVTDLSVYPDIATRLPLDGPTFLADLSSEQVRLDLWAEFRESRELGLSAFPTLLIARPDGFHLLNRGYSSADALEERLVNTFGLPRAGD